MEGPFISFCRRIPVFCYSCWEKKTQGNDSLMVMLATRLPDTEALVPGVGPQALKMEKCLSSVSCVTPFSCVFQLIAWLITNSQFFHPLPSVTKVLKKQVS